MIEEFKHLKRWVEECPIEATMRIQELEEKVEKLKKVEDAKLAFVSNGLEEKIYVLQETVSEYEDAMMFAINYLKSSDISQVQVVVKRIEKALNRYS